MEGPLMPSLTEEYQQDTAKLCAAAAARGVTFPPREVRLLGRTTKSGLLVCAEQFKGGDEVPWVWFITDCCGAAAKGGGDGIYCKGCFNDVDPAVGDVYTIAWHGDVVPPTADDEVIFKKGFSQ